jgi:DNA-binding response OmpR family regulator
MSLINAGKLKILVVEDDVFMQTVLKQYLSTHYEIEACANGLEALSLLQEHPDNVPDLIISDLNTPGLNGLGLINQLKAGDLFSAIPIMILSGEENSEMRIQCLDAGADDYVVKPFNPRELESRIKVILRRVSK